MAAELDVTFVVNGADWRFDGMSVQDVYGQVDRFLTLVADARRSGDKVWIGDDFQRRPMLEDEDLWSLVVRNGRLALDDQLLQELTAWLMQAPLYLDEEAWPDGTEETDITIGLEPAISNPDVAWVHHSVRAGERRGVLSLAQSGPIHTTTALGTADVFFALTPSDHQLFWRTILRQSPRGL